MRGRGAERERRGVAEEWGPPIPWVSGAPTLCKLLVPLLLLPQGVRGCVSCLHIGAAPSRDWASHSVLGPASS